MARLMPISRVRSAIDIAIVLTTERPPTTRLMRAIPTRIELRIEVAPPICLSKSLPVIVATLGTWALISAATVCGFVPGRRVDGQPGRDLRGGDSLRRDERRQRLDDTGAGRRRAGRPRRLSGAVSVGSRIADDRERTRRAGSIVSPTCLSYWRARSEPRTVDVRALVGRGQRAARRRRRIGNVSRPWSAPATRP